MAEFEFKAEPRKEIGRGPSKRLRAEGFVPATVYGAKKDPEAIVLSQKDVLKALMNDAVFSHILTLKIGSESQKVVIKSLERHPSRPQLMHMDFLRINTKEKIIIKVPLHFLGEEECPGVKAGGVLSRVMTELEIKCLPSDLPEAINIDVSTLEMDHAIHLSEVKIPQGVELAHIEITEENDPPVISVAEPKVTQEDIEAEAKEAELAEEAAAEAAGGAEGEEVKAEGKEGAEGDKAEAGKDEAAKEDGAKDDKKSEDKKDKE